MNTKQVNLDTPSTGGGDYTPSVLRPGNYKLKINNLALKEDKFATKLTLFVESEPISGAFKGLPKVKELPNGECYKGQVGYVSMDRFGYKDWVNPNGPGETKRDDELARAIGLLCRGLGMTDWWNYQDWKGDKKIERSFNKVDDLVADFIADRPFEGKWFFACLSGREYQNGKYVNNELFFGKSDRTLGEPYHTDEARVQKFFASSHIVRLESKSTDTTTAPTPDATKTTTTEAAKPANLSQAEKDFIAEGERVKKEKATQSNMEFLKEMNETNPVEVQAKDIVKNNDENPYMPWDPEYTTWKPGDKGPQ